MLIRWPQRAQWSSASILEVPGEASLRFAPTALVLLAVSAPAQEPPQVPSFRAGIDLVTVDVVVLDDKGQPVRGLRREDFALLEDGRPQEIATFEPVEDTVATGGAVAAREGGPPARVGARPALPPGARTFVLLVDDMSIAPHRAGDVREALGRLVNDGLGAGDELIFATTSGDQWWRATMPDGRDDLLALVSRVRGRNLTDTAPDSVSDWEAFRIVHVEAGGGRAATGIDGVAPRSAPPSGVPQPASLPATDTTDRIVMRYYDRRVCNPEEPGATPREQCAAMVRSRAHLVDQRRMNRTRDVLAGVDRAVFALTGHRGRKALLLLTEGFLNDPDLRGMQEVAGRCREANVAVYSIDVRGLFAGNPGLGAQDLGSPNTAEVGLMRAETQYAAVGGNEGLAEDTGGIAIRDTNDLGGGAVRVAAESRVYYLLGFAPPEGKGSRDWRKLKVTVSRPGVTVRARKGYTLRTSVEMAGPIESAPDRRPPDVTRALLAPQEKDDIPLRARAYSFGDRPGGKVAVVVAVEADTARLANLGGDRPRSSLTLNISATHRDTGVVTKVDQKVTVEAGLGSAWEGWLALQRELELPAGVAQARIVVRDDFLGRVGATTIRFEVPTAGGMRLSTPVLTDRLLQRGPGQLPAPVLLARREFGPRGRLFCQFQVIGARPVAGLPGAAESRFVIRRVGGETVTEGPPGVLSLGADGRWTGIVGVPLDGMREGPYELVLKVNASGQVLETTESFRVAAGS